MGIHLSLLGLALAAVAVLKSGLFLLLLWPAAAYLAVGVAYLAGAPGVLGKRRDGRIAWWARVAFWPYLAFAWAIWASLRLSGEPCHNEVAPGVWVGRRPLHGELPPGAAVILDMTAEFSLDRGLRGMAYHCLPTLDGAAPASLADFQAVIAAVTAQKGGLYIHCAAGHARSATAAAAVMMARGHAATVDEAESLMRVQRPGVRLNRHQRRFLAGLGGR